MTEEIVALLLKVLTAAEEDSQSTQAEWRTSSLLELAEELGYDPIQRLRETLGDDQ